MSGSADVPARLGPQGRHQRGALFQRPTRALRRDVSQLVCAAVGLALGLPPAGPARESSPACESIRPMLQWVESSARRWRRGNRPAVCEEWS